MRRDVGLIEVLVFAFAGGVAGAAAVTAALEAGETAATAGFAEAAASDDAKDDTEDDQGTDDDDGNGWPPVQMRVSIILSNKTEILANH